METLLRWREPLTVVVLVALGVRLVIGLALSIGGGLYVAGQSLAVAAVALAFWCTRAPATRRARTLLLVAVVAAGASVVVELGWLLVRAVFAVGGVETFLALLPELVLPALAAVAGVALLRTVPSEATPPAVPGSSAAESLATPAPGRELEHQPYWQVDQASGAAWTTAGDAAAGAPTAGWGQDPESSWQPIPRQAPNETSSSSTSEDTTWLPRRDPGRHL